MSDGRDDDIRVRPEDGREPPPPPGGFGQPQPRGRGGLVTQNPYSPGGQQQPQEQQPPPPQLHLTSDEQRVLQACGREAFYYRSLPLSCLAMAAVAAAGRAGHIAASPTYGLAPKTFAAGLLGYFVGKFSYAEACADKFLSELPDSNIAARVRQRRGLAPREGDEALMAGVSPDALKEQPEAPPAPAMPDGGEQSPAQQGEEGKRQGMTYEDLRRQNHEQFERQQQQQQQGVGRQSPRDYRSPLWDPRQQQIPPRQGQQQQGQQDQQEEPYSQSDPNWSAPSKMRKKPPTNKYGDEGFE